MRNASEIEQGDAEIRATFVVPKTLADEFRELANRRERTFSAELRQLMRAEIDREREAA
jgi:hypothetical protein